MAKFVGKDRGYDIYNFIGTHVLINGKIGIVDFAYSSGSFVLFPDGESLLVEGLSHCDLERIRQSLKK